MDNLLSGKGETSGPPTSLYCNEYLCMAELEESLYLARQEGGHVQLISIHVFNNELIYELSHTM